MALFTVAVERLLEKEGGYVNDPNDPGGETMWGLSTRRYPELDIRSLSRDDASRLYQRDFWNPLYDRIETQALGTKLLELTVHLPHGDTRPFYETDMTGVRLVQQALHVLGHTVEVDGRFGPQTLLAVRLMNPHALLEAVKVQQVKHYAQLVAANQSLRPFLLGWLRRAVAVAVVCCLPVESLGVERPVESLASAAFDQLRPRACRGELVAGGVERPVESLWVERQWPASSAQDLGSAPMCRGVEIGFWQPLVDAERKKVGVVLTRIDELTPHSLVCRLGSAQRVQALPPEVQL